MGSRGYNLIDDLLREEDTQIVAICDVDDRTLGEAEKKYPGAKVYNDWRRLLKLVTTMLSRRATASEVPIVKPTDSCNNIIPQLISDIVHS